MTYFGDSKNNHWNRQKPIAPLSPLSEKIKINLDSSNVKNCTAGFLVGNRFPPCSCWHGSVECCSAAKINTDKYCVEVELISCNCGLCYFTLVWFQILQPIPSSSHHSLSPSLGNSFLMNFKHRHARTHLQPHTQQPSNEWSAFLLTGFSFTEWRVREAFQVFVLWGLPKVHEKTSAPMCDRVINRASAFKLLQMFVL